MIVCDSNINLEAWNDLLKHTPLVTPFQTPGWYDFHRFYDNDAQKPFAVAVKRGEESIAALASGTIHQEPGYKAGLTRRAIISGGLLLSPGNEQAQAIDELLHALHSYLCHQGVIYAEIRNLSDYSAFLPQFVRMGWSYEPHLNFHVDSIDREAMWQRLSSGRRRDIRYGEKKGVTMRLAGSERDVTDWYQILSDLYREKVKTPLPDIAYFQALHRYPKCRLVLVDYRQRVIGGLLGLVEPGNVFCDLFCCGLDDEYKSERIYPSILATWGAMELACREGISRFDFMGAGKPGVPYGVRDFKAKFGGELVEYGRFLKVFAPIRYALGKWAVSVMKRWKK